MSDSVLVAIVSLIGTILGSLSGILVTKNMVNYRLVQLEKKVEKHNNLCERMIAVEQSVKAAHHRLDEGRSF